MNCRAVVTGIGFVTPLGCDVESVWRNASRGHSAVKAIDSLTACPHIRFGSRVEAFDAYAAIGDRKLVRAMNLPTAFGVAAALAAAKDAGWDQRCARADRVGVYAGALCRNYDYEEFGAAVTGCSRAGKLDLVRFGQAGLRAINPLWVLRGFGNSVLYYVTVLMQAMGVNCNFHLGGVSGTVAIGEACRAIERGAADAVFAGGYDSLFESEQAAWLGASGFLTSAPIDDSGPSRPFDKRRDGFVLSEGAAWILIEDVDHAKARNARIYAEVAGYGNCSAPRDLESFGPSALGFRIALEQAMADANCDRVDAVIAHGLGTRVTDREEAMAIRSMCGARLSRVAVTAPKSLFGNSGAASGAIETALACLALERACLPPTANCEVPDPYCDLNIITEPAYSADVNTIGLNNANLAGTHAALVLRRAV